MASRAAVATVLRLARPWPRPVSSPAAVMLVGPPGVGKTAFARALRERTAVAVIESDAVREALFAAPTHGGAESAAVFEAIHAALRELLARGVSALLDATNLVERDRAVVYGIAEDLGARLIVVRVTAPASVVRKRLEAGGERGASRAGVAEFERMRRRGQPIGRRHHTVDTTGSTREAVEAVAREIEAR
ncbi:MAG TPA: AAA family ATPase [Dehalococcoidia bacterium]|nr:AAA family ATPase [Dehalococcoidia bacterium]